MPITSNHGIFFPDRTMQVSEFRQHLATLAQSTDDALQSIIDGYVVTPDLSGLPSSGNWVGRRAWVTSLGYEVVWTGSIWEAPGVSENLFPSVHGRLTRSASYVIGADEKIVAFNQWAETSNGVTMASNGIRVSEPGLYAVDTSLTLTSTSGTNAARIVTNGVNRTYRYLVPHSSSGTFRITWTDHIRLNAEDLVQIAVSAGAPAAALASSSEFAVTRISPR